MAPLKTYFTYNLPESIKNSEEALHSERCENCELSGVQNYMSTFLVFVFLLVPVIICFKILSSLWGPSTEPNNIDTTQSHSYGQLEMQVEEQPVAEDASDPTDIAEESDDTASESSGSEDELIDEENLMDMTCQICMVNRKDRILLPCGHLFCSECTIRVKKHCFICRTRVKSVKNCYL